MASSLDERCNESKHRYDTCFNHWLKNYLVLVAPPISDDKERQKRASEIEKSKKELDGKCGALYETYQSCVWRGIKSRDGLMTMLDDARKEEPLDKWHGIKVTTQDDLD